MGRWAGGRAGGQVGRWADGQMGRWAGGQVGKRAGGQTNITNSGGNYIFFLVAAISTISQLKRLHIN